MKKLFIMLLLNIIYISAFADNTNITKHLFFTLEGSIDKYPITMQQGNQPQASSVRIPNYYYVPENKMSAQEAMDSNPIYQMTVKPFKELHIWKEDGPIVSNFEVPSSLK